MPSEKVGCLFVLLKLLGLLPPGTGAQPLPYRVRDDFLSAAERSFYGVLLKACGDRATVCPKVRIADVLFVAERRANQAHVNRIQSKHVDFLLCAPDTMRPLAAVELDDRSHDRADRRERDVFVNAAFGAAGLPVFRFPAQAAYNMTQIVSAMAEVLGEKQQRQVAEPTANNPAPPCPKCGVPMVARIAKQGAHAGRSFWGCPNYPRCRETRQIEP